MAVKTALVAGANRGIGLEFVKKFHQHGWHVVGTIRPATREDTSDPSFKELEATGAKVLDLDFRDEASIIKAAKEYGDGPLDCLVNCGGVKPTPQIWHEHSSEFVTDQLLVMVLGPFLLTKHFFPNLKKASGKVANISAGFGTISTNERGLFIGYRMAKAALNQQTKTLSRDFEHNGDNVTIIALNPGYIATRMTGHKGVVDMTESVSDMVDIIEKATLKDSGHFFDYTGDELPF